MVRAESPGTELLRLIVADLTTDPGELRSREAYYLKVFDRQELKGGEASLARYWVSKTVKNFQHSLKALLFSRDDHAALLLRVIKELG